MTTVMTVTPHPDASPVPGTSLDRRVVARAGLAMLAGLVCAVWFGARTGGHEVVLWTDNLATTLAALTATVHCARASRRAGEDQRFWWLFAIACACWTLAELTWGVYEVVLREPVPAASWADIPYLAAVAVAIAALPRHPAMSASPMRRARRALDAVVVAVALLFSSWTLVLQPLWESTDLSGIGGVVALAYPMGDAVILSFIVLALRGVAGPHRQAMWCLLLGLTAMALSDSAYAYLVGVRSYSSGGALDAGWIVAYLAIAVAASCSDARHVVRVRPARFSASPLPALVAPFVPVLAALTLAAVQMEHGRALDHVAWTSAFVLVMLVLARLTLVVFETLRGSRGEAPTPLGARLARAAVGEPADAGNARRAGPRGDGSAP
jgi:hypothetical protein